MVGSRGIEPLAGTTPPFAATDLQSAMGRGARESRRFIREKDLSDTTKTPVSGVCKNFSNRSRYVGSSWPYGADKGAGFDSQRENQGGQR